MSLNPLYIESTKHVGFHHMKLPQSWPKKAFLGFPWPFISFFFFSLSSTFRMEFYRLLGKKYPNQNFRFVSGKSVMTGERLFRSFLIALICGAWDRHLYLLRAELRICWACFGHLYQHSDWNWFSLFIHNRNKTKSLPPSDKDLILYMVFKFGVIRSIGAHINVIHWHS